MTEPAKPISLEAKRAEPVEAVVQMLRGLLADAKAGKIRAMIYATVETDCRGWGHNGDYENQRIELLGALSMARCQMEHEIWEDAGGADASGKPGRSRATSRTADDRADEAADDAATTATERAQGFASEGGFNLAPTAPK